MMFHGKPEGCYRCTNYMALAPLWFSLLSQWFNSLGSFPVGCTSLGVDLNLVPDLWSALIALLKLLHFPIKVYAAENCFYVNSAKWYNSTQIREGFINYCKNEGGKKVALFTVLRIVCFLLTMKRVALGALIYQCVFSFLDTITKSLRGSEV